MQRLFYLLPLLAVVLGTPGCGPDAAQQPNIIFILADDQSYETVNAFGNGEVITPNLDRLANQSFTFTNAYNMGAWQGAVCISSRTMLNTGHFLWNAQQETREKNSIDHLREQGKLWSQLMEQAGYETYMTGKWHVGASAEQSFTYTTDIRAGMPKQTKRGYNRPVEGSEDKWSPWDTAFGGYWEGGTHWTKRLGDNAISFINEAAGKEKPFFMYLAFNAAHDPRQSPKEYLDKYPIKDIPLPENFLEEYPYKDSIGCGRSLRDEKLAPFPRTPYSVKVNRREYYALITYMDEQIGRLIGALEKSGKADNTYIFFTADHGLSVGHHGLIGKQNMYEHSMRVPLMVSGKGIPGNRRTETPVYLQDIMPSTLELAGAAIPADVEFRSLLPLIEGERDVQYHAIYGAYRHLQRMVIDEGFKLILYPAIHVARLYNLEEDPLEMNDLAADPAYEERMKELFATFLQLQEETGDSLDIREDFPGLII